MVYVDGLCTDFGEQEKREMCRYSNDIGRACNMSHAERVVIAGVGEEEVWFTDFFFGFLFLGWSLQRSSLSVFWFWTEGWKMAKEARAVRGVRKCGQACG